jgi:cytidylate kinase
VAISRQAGARGGTLARKLGELLGWQVFDHDTLDYLAQSDTAREQFLAEVPDTARAWADAHLGRVRRKHPATAAPEASAVVHLILMVAARGDAIILGRGAGFLLPRDTTVHARVVAPPDARVAYLAEQLRLTRAEAADEVRARDARRAEFVTRTVGFDPDDPTGYDVVVNSERLGIEPAAQFLGWAVRTKQQFAELRAADDPGPFGDPTAA